MTLNAKAANLGGTSFSILSANACLYPEQHNRLCFSAIFSLFFLHACIGADSSYLSLHKLGVVLVDLHLFDLLLSVLCVQ